MMLVVGCDLCLNVELLFVCMVVEIYLWLD